MPVSELEIIFGIHPILEVLRTRPQSIREITIQKSKATGSKLQEIFSLAKESQCSVRFVSRLADPADGRAVLHQGVMALVTPIPTISLQELIKKTKNTPAPLLVALDSIQDPFNLGAIIRSACAAGALGIILPRDRSAPLSGVAIKASAGATAHMDISRVTNLSRALKQLKDAGFWIFGTAGNAKNTLFNTDLTGPACLVIGGEGKGMRALIREQCDFLVSIPMYGKLDSLNASVAAGIVLFERVRQMREAAQEE